MKIEPVRMQTLHRAATTGRPAPQGEEATLPADQVALQGVEPTAPVEQVQAAPEPQPETQQAAIQFVTDFGSHHFQRMVQGISPQTLPTFKTMGEAANQLAGGSQPDLYFHLSQSLHHLGVALDNAEERLAHNPGADRAQLIGEEMQVQAKALTLLPYAAPELLAQVEGEGAQFKTTAESSKDSQVLELMRSKLPAEVVGRADAELAAQPLFQAAARPEQLNLPTYDVHRLQDIAGDFLPTALGARGVFFRAAAGQAGPPGLEFAQLTRQHALHFAGPGGTLAQHSEKVADFTRALVPAGQSENPAEAFQAASQTSILLLGIDLGGPFGKEHEATRQLALQRCLMGQAGPVILQAAQPPGPAAEVPENSKRAALMQISRENQLAAEPDYISGFNQRVIGMLSEDQAGKALLAFADDSLLAALDREPPEGRWAEHFQLRSGGGQRVRESIEAFADTQLKLQQVVVDHTDAQALAG